MAYSAFKSFDENKIDKQVRAGKHSLIVDYDLESIPSDYIKPLKSAILVTYNNTGSDVRINPILEAYTKARPLDSEGWLKASALLQRQGSLDEAVKYLLKARDASHKNTHGLIRVFIRALELDKIDLAESVFRDIVTFNPNYFSRYFKVLSRLDGNYKKLLANTIPDEVPTFKEFKKDYYFISAMSVALRQKNDELADEVWNLMPAKYRVDSAIGVRYLSSIMRRAEPKRYADVWRSLAGESIKISQFSNNDFESTENDLQPCFRSGKAKGVRWSISDSEYQGKRALNINFDGSHNVNLTRVNCTLVLKPGATYELSGEWASKNITTLSGLYWDVYFPKAKERKVLTDSLLGSNPWKDFSIKFKVPADVGLATFRLRRNRTDRLDSKISGSVSVDNLNLNLKLISN